MCATTARSPAPIRRQPCFSTRRIVAENIRSSIASLLCPFGTNTPSLTSAELLRDLRRTMGQIDGGAIEEGQITASMRRWFITNVTHGFSGASPSFPASPVPSLLNSSFEPLSREGTKQFLRIVSRLGSIPSRNTILFCVDQPLNQTRE